MLGSLRKRRFDVVVAGGGPAGATAARLLAHEHGLSVLVVERSAVPRQNPGETLTASVHGILERLGAEAAVDAAGFVPLRQVRLYLGAQCVQYRVAPVEDFRPSRPYGLGIRREEFDPILLAAARDAGVEILRGARVAEVSVLPGGRPVVVIGQGSEKVTLSPRVVIAADGRGSVAATKLGLRAPLLGRRRMAIHAYFAGVAELVERAEGHAAHPFLVSLAPVGPDRANVFATVPLDVVRDRAGAISAFEDAVRGSTLLRERLRGARPLTGFSTFTGFSYGFRALYKGGVVLVGDAAACQDPITTSGVTIAMREAEWAADEIGRFFESGADDPGPFFGAYEERVRRLLRGRHLFNQILFAIGGRPALLDRVTRQLDRDPEVRSLFFGVFQGAVPVDKIVRPHVLLRMAFPEPTSGRRAERGSAGATEAHR